MATTSYQLLDPTFCSVLRAQEVIFAYVIQMIAFDVVPCYISVIGAALVLTRFIFDKFLVLRQD